MTAGLTTANCDKMNQGPSPETERESRAERMTEITITDINTGRKRIHGCVIDVIKAYNRGTPIVYLHTTHDRRMHGTGQNTFIYPSDHEYITQEGEVIEIQANSSYCDDIKNRNVSIFPEVK